MYELLSIAEGEPWSDGGWTKVASKTKDGNQQPEGKSINGCNHQSKSTTMDIDNECNVYLSLQ